MWGEAYIEIEKYWGDGHALSVKCEFCSKEERIGSNSDFCDTCPHKEINRI